MNLLRNADFRAGAYEPVGQMALVLPDHWLAGWLDKGSLYRVIPASEATGLALALARAFIAKDAPSEEFRIGYEAMGYAPQQSSEFIVEIYGVYNDRGPRHRPNMAKCLKPEVLTIGNVTPYLDPPRTETPDQAVTGFKLYGTLCWWLCQRVNVTAGRKYRLGMRAHAWARATEDPGDARYSHGVGLGPFHVAEGSGATDDQQNYRFRVGVDLDGNLDSIATAGTLWANGAHIYNEFWDVPALEFTAAGHLATVYLMVDNLWGFVNSNAYLSRPFLEEVTLPELAELTARVDALEVRVAALEAETPPPPPEPPPPPPPPTVKYPSRLDSLAGFHIEATGAKSDGKTGYGYGAWLKDMNDAHRRPTLMKGFLTAGELMQLKKEIPGSITIWRGRLLKEDEDNPRQGEDWKWDPSQNASLARYWINGLLDRAKVDLPYITYIEAINEPNGALPIQFQNQNAFLLECMKYIDSLNNPNLPKLAICSWSSGCPKSPLIKPDEADELSFFVPALEYAALHGHILAVHDGSLNDARPLFRQAYDDKTALRYRYVKAMMDALGKPMPAVAVTEGYWPDGYRNHNPWDDLIWYLTEMGKDRYVLGFCWFTLGGYSFDNSTGVNVVGQMIRYLEAAKKVPIIQDSLVQKIKNFVLARH